jgi:hypothetical protein
MRPRDNRRRAGASPVSSILAAALIRVRHVSKTERMAMAAEGDAKELNVHRIGYDRFVTLIKWSAAACLVIALIVIFLIAE